MAQPSGRNAYAAVFGALVGLVVVAALAYLVLPIVPAAVQWVANLVAKTGWFG